MPTIITSDARSREKPCLRCGYSLRRLGDSTHCPECGLSVWLSLNQNDVLDLSSPTWLRRMALGLLLMAAAHAIALAGHAVVLPHYLDACRWEDDFARIWQAGFGMEDQGASLFAGMRSRPELGAVHVRVAMGLAGAYLLAFCTGMLLLTSPEQRYPDRLKTARVTSWIIGGVMLLVVAWIALDIGSPRPGTSWWGLTKLAAVAAGFMTLAYLRRIARRIPSTKLARICAWLMIGPALGALRVIALRDFHEVGHLAWLVDAALVIYLLASGGLFGWFALIFFRDSRLARRNWDNETAPADIVKTSG